VDLMLGTPIYGHIKGQCWVSPDRQVAFVPIPKCASQSMRYFLAAHATGPDVWTDEIWSPEIEFTFAVFREPVERYLSGWSEWCRRCGLGNDTILIDEPFERDEHTTLQVRFLEGIEVDRLIPLDELAPALREIWAEYGWAYPGDPGPTNVWPRAKMPTGILHDRLMDYLAPGLAIWQRMGR
jgi:hypothetical protein